MTEVEWERYSGFPPATANEAVRLLRNGDAKITNYWEAQDTIAGLKLDHLFLPSSLNQPEGAL